MQLNPYNRLFSLFVLLFEAHFFPLPTFYLFRESFSFFLSTKLIPWYKSFFWFLCMKALLSPPLLGRQPNLFVKRSLNLDGYLFSCAWKFLSISFALSPFASTFIFCFAWKILSIRRTPYAVGRQRRVFLLYCRLIHQYFFSAWKFLFVRGFPPLFLIVLLSLHRCISSFSSSVFFLFFRENYSYFIFNI